MKKPSVLFTTLLLSVAGGAALRALDATAWRYQQPFEVAQAGAMRVALPPETLDRLQPDLRDLRIVGADGTESPYAVLELPAARAASQTLTVTRRPVSLRIDPEKKEVIATLSTETGAPLDSVALLIADTTDYMLPARVEISGDGNAWRTLASGLALFRRGQGGGYNTIVQNTLPLDRRSAAFVRVTISTGETSLAITGAELRVIKETAAREAMPDDDAPARIVATEQRAGETLLTIDLGAANLSLSTLSFQIADPLFMRHVTLTGTDGRELARGEALYRVEIPGQVSTSKTALAPGGLFVPERRILARIENGDSPPLDVRGVGATRRPVHIAFNPAVAGRFTFLAGNAQARAPRYDLAVLSGRLASLPLSRITAGASSETPDYRAPAPASDKTSVRDIIGSAFFWLALTAVVIVLFVVIAKLLPKPKA
ncbi:MAG: DUF3999 domain-containing protein [Opitutaceae bacterium]|jgi:hypothetical protein|nr:DUF3999 domain-containing protein [Opitutaceae bacterium]